jgi:hypothetical protein
MNSEEIVRLEAQRDGYLKKFKELSRKVETQRKRVDRESAKLAELQRLQGHVLGPLQIYQAQLEKEEDCENRYH